MHRKKLNVLIFLNAVIIFVCQMAFSRPHRAGFSFSSRYCVRLFPGA